MRLSVFPLALLLVAGCAEVTSLSEAVRPSHPASDGAIPTDVPRTTWSTTYGEMALSPLRDGRVTAYYEGENGTLDGTLSGLRYTGIWVEPSSGRTCSTVRRGSDHWGQFEYTFNAALDRFEGVWGYCEETPTRGWDGTKR